MQFRNYTSFFYHCGSTSILLPKNIPYGDGKPNNNIADKDSNVYGGGNLSTYNGPQFVTTSGKVNGNGDEFSKYYTNQMVNRNGSNRGKMSDDEYDMPKSNHFNPALKMKQMSGDKQVRDYFNGKSKYVKGKGWQ